MPMTVQSTNKQAAVAQLRRKGVTGRVMEIRKITPGGRRDGDKAWSMDM